MARDSKQYLDQGLATVNNYYWIGLPDKAVKLLEVIRKLDPSHELIGELYSLIVSDTLGASRPDLSKHFGRNWRGESLRGSSIEVFTDFNIGNTINFFRYLAALKREWECRIVLNCYSAYEALKKLMEDVWFVDEFTNQHVLCDYHTNIMCIPALLSGLKLDHYYPADRSVILKTKVPWQPEILPHGEAAIQPNRPACGLHVKQIPEEQMAVLKESGWNIYTLPNTESMLMPSTYDFNDVAILIDAMDAVIATDSSVLHLAGTMNKPTFGLMKSDDNPLWDRSKTTMWYDTVKLFWQSTEGDWSEPIRRVREELELITDISYDVDDIWRRTE